MFPDASNRGEFFLLLVSVDLYLIDLCIISVFYSSIMGIAIFPPSTRATVLKFLLTLSLIMSTNYLIIGNTVATGYTVVN